MDTETVWTDMMSVNLWLYLPVFVLYYIGDSSFFSHKWPGTYMNTRSRTNALARAHLRTHTRTHTLFEPCYLCCHHVRPRTLTLVLGGHCIAVRLCWLSWPLTVAISCNLYATTIFLFVNWTINHCECMCVCVNHEGHRCFVYSLSVKPAPLQLRPFIRRDTYDLRRRSSFPFVGQE